MLRQTTTLTQTQSQITLVYNLSAYWLITQEILHYEYCIILPWQSISSKLHRASPISDYKRLKTWYYLGVVINIIAYIYDCNDLPGSLFLRALTPQHPHINTNLDWECVALSLCGRLLAIVLKWLIMWRVFLVINLWKFFGNVVWTLNIWAMVLMTVMEWLKILSLCFLLVILKWWLL